MSNQKSNPEKKERAGEEIRKLYRKLKYFISGRISSAEDASDILQEVFYQFARADYLSSSIEQVEAWLYAVARNQIIDWRKKKKPLLISDQVSSARKTDTEEDILSEEINDILFENPQTPEDELLHSMIWSELEAALGEIPEEQRKAFELTELEGLSFKEISAMTGVQVNTLISRKRYAVLYLRERLKILYEELLES